MALLTEAVPMLARSLTAFGVRGPSLAVSALASGAALLCGGLCLRSRPTGGLVSASPLATVGLAIALLSVVVLGAGLTGVLTLPGIVPF